jgi:hypothetical protein
MSAITQYDAVFLLKLPLRIFFAGRALSRKKDKKEIKTMRDD